MQTKPFISIITVSFNAEEVLERTILSIINQSYTNYEYIIIDGASTDSTTKIIEKYKIKIHKYLSEPDEGIYDAMNKALKMAEGDYVWFMNAGDQLYDNQIFEYIFEKHNTADIIYSDTLVVNKEGKEVGLLSKLTHNNAPKELHWKMMQKGMVVCHQSFLVKREITPFYDINYKYSSDVDWVIKCLKKADNTFLSDKILTRFLNAGLSKANLKTAMKERFFILQKHFGILPNIINHIIMLIRYFIRGRKSKV